MSINVCFGPQMEEIERESDGERFCFTCRKRREFFYVVTAPKALSYYGASRFIRCGTCDTSDGDVFPGRSREWDD